MGFVAAVSRKAWKAMSRKIKEWELKKLVPLTLEEIAEEINPQVRGWMNYYGRYYRSAVYSTQSGHLYRFNPATSSSEQNQRSNCNIGVH